MVDTGIFATTAEVQYKAGANVSTTYNAEVYINSFMTQAESFINTACRYNFSDAYTSLNVDVKGLLKDAASNIAACYVINADLSLMNLAEAQTRLNFLWARAQDCINLLKLQDNVTYVKGA